MRPKIFRGILPLKKVGTSLGVIIPKIVRNITNIVLDNFPDRNSKSL